MPTPEFEAESRMLVAMSTRVLRWDGISLDDNITQFCEQIRRFVRDGKLDRDFYRWCQGAAAPVWAARLQKKWAQLLFGSCAFAMYAGDRNQMLAAFPFFDYLRVYGGTVFCSDHRELNGFVARKDDPIWGYIYPPNGWMCACSVLGLTEEEAAKEARPGYIVPLPLATACRDWLDIFPSHQLSLL